MSVPLGLSIPKLLPITGSFLAPFSIYYSLLSLRVVNQRVKNDKSLETTISDSPNDPLLASIRSQVNFAENVPLALVIAAVAELNGGNRKVLTGALTSLFIFRILHVELGIMSSANNGMGNGRPVGHLGTLGFLVGMAGYAGYLVKGYWGF